MSSGLGRFGVSFNSLSRDQDPGPDGCRPDQHPFQFSLTRSVHAELRALRVLLLSILSHEISSSPHSSPPSSSSFQFSLTRSEALEKVVKVVGDAPFNSLSRDQIMRSFLRT